MSRWGVTFVRVSLATNGVAKVRVRVRVGVRVRARVRVRVIVQGHLQQINVIFRVMHQSSE